MAGPKSVFEMVHISRAEVAEENNLPRVLEKRVCLFADTFTYGSNCWKYTCSVFIADNLGITTV